MPTRINRLVNRIAFGVAALLAIIPFIWGWLESTFLPVYSDQHVQYPFRTTHPVYGASLCWFWRSDKAAVHGRQFLAAHGEVLVEGRGNVVAIPWAWRTGESFRAQNAWRSQDDFQRVVCLAWDGDFGYRKTAKIVMRYTGILPGTEIVGETPLVIVIPPIPFRPYPYEEIMRSRRKAEN